MARGAPGFSLRAASAADLPRLAELIVGHPLFERYALTPAALERGLVAAHARDLFLLVTCENAAAQRLYRRHGFVAVGVLNDYVRPGVDELLMRKSRPEAPPLVPLTAG
jgi:RimJ/RimL family protein N-acetyltransferase